MRKTLLSVLAAPILAAAAVVALAGCIPMPPTVTPATQAPETETASDPAPSSTPTSTPTETPTESPSSMSEGTRDQPFPAGTPLTSEDWDVVVGVTELDVNAIVADANMFNDPPAEGNVYIRVPITATYTGADSATTMDVSIAYVSASGVAVETYDTFVVVDDDNPYQELYAGGSASYFEYLEVPAAGVEQGLIRVEVGFFGGPEAFVSLA